ncbi:MAG: hypothetical protein ACPGXY_01390 [Alphaproteobacteria bacterium]
MLKKNSRYALAFLVMTIGLAGSVGRADEPGEVLRNTDVTVDQAKVLVKEILKSSQGQKALKAQVEYHRQAASGSSDNTGAHFDIPGISTSTAEKIIMAAIDNGSYEWVGEQRIRIYWEALPSQLAEYGAPKGQLYLGTYGRKYGDPMRSRKIAVEFSFKGISQWKDPSEQIDLLRITQQIREDNGGRFRRVYPVKPTMFARKTW